jgi:hypothetical protein
VDDDVMLTPQPATPAHGDPSRASVENRGDNRSEDLARFMVVWNGALHEFRNHLTVLLASTTEVRSSLPASVSAPELLHTLAETERNVQGLNSLIAQLDAAVKVGEPLVSDLDDILQRALRIAAPAMGGSVSVSIRKGRKAGVKNRGAALECLLSTLLIDLGRAAEVRAGGPRPKQPHLEVLLDIGRQGLVVEIESNGAAPAPGSWRLALAHELAAKLDAHVTPHPQTAGYVIQFR